MRRIGHFFVRSGRFLISYLISLAFHWEGALPAVLLLVLHFWPGIPLYWFWIALGLWLLVVLIRILFLRFAIRSSDPTPFRPNRNPYSKTYKPGKGMTGDTASPKESPASAKGAEQIPSLPLSSVPQDPVPADGSTEDRQNGSSSISPQPR